MNIETMGAFALYLGTLAAISFAFYNRTMSSSDFALGSRSLNYIATAIAAHTSDMSIWLFMGFPGTVYLMGVEQAWVPLGLISGMFLSWTFVAQRLRTETETYNSLTLSDYLEHRFNDTSGMIRLVSALAALTFFIFYISSGLVGMGIMFETVFEIDYHTGILLGLTTTVLYTFFGGFVGVAWCDLFQGLFLVIMIMLVPFYSYFYLEDGLHSVQLAAQLKHISLAFIPDTFSQLIDRILLAVGWGIGYFGQPHILANFMGIKNASEIKKARNVGMLWQIITLGCAFAVGLIGIALFPVTLHNSELVFVSTVQKLFFPFTAGIILCAIIAAGLTTIDMQILVSGSIVSEDIYKRFFNPTASSQRLLAVSKAGVILVPLLSFLIAFNKSTSVYGLVNYAWSGLGSTFGPLILFSLYSSKGTIRGALLGMIAGCFLAAVWPLTGSTVPAMIPAFFTNLALLLIFS